MTKEWLSHRAWHWLNSTFTNLFHYVYEVCNLTTSDSQRRIVYQSDIIIQLATI